ncbi:hypothetical protein OG601_46430 [Streptomyces sp. NBC_01239]|nr:hypothetical protein [Streptomyces sp. NBC_01239]MCX4818017.1 hypothetical protein [Streptomyces sp. NBC_01239]
MVPRIVSVGKRMFGPAPYKSTAGATTAHGTGREVREIAKAGS